MEDVIVLFFLNDKQFSSHMAKISEHVNFSNHKNPFQWTNEKMIVNLRLYSKKYKNNKNFSCQLNRLQNSLLMSIVDAPKMT